MNDLAFNRWRKQLEEAVELFLLEHRVSDPDDHLFNSAIETGI